MSWKETNAMDERFRFVLDYESGAWTMSELCRRYGVSRPCGYKWAQRYEREGPKGLEDRPRTPGHCPHALDVETEEAVVAMRRKHPSWGPRKIRAKLIELEPERSWPASSTIGDALTRHGLTVPRRKRRRSEPNAAGPLAEDLLPNEVWSVDFKGWFTTGDGARCDPLTLQDAASRYLLRCQRVSHLDYQAARAVMEAAFREYGLPDALRSDNGQPFASVGAGGLTRLSIWWVRLGITPMRIRPGKPQDNGRHERFHRTLKAETASPPAKNLRAQQASFTRFRREFNEERPHEALGQRPPASAYAPSARGYPTRLPELVYPEDLMEVRTVEGNGLFRFRGAKWFLSHTLGGEKIGVAAIDERYCFVYFSHILLAVVDLAKERVLKPGQARKRVPGFEVAHNYISRKVSPSPRGGRGEARTQAPSQETQETEEV